MLNCCWDFLRSSVILIGPRGEAVERAPPLFTFLDLFTICAAASDAHHLFHFPALRLLCTFQVGRGAQRVAADAPRCA